jgi:hypothetical protein
VSIGKKSFKPVGNALKVKRRKAGWMKIRFVNKATIIGNGNLGNNLLTLLREKVPLAVTL